MPCSLLWGYGVSSMGEPRSAACSFAAAAGAPIAMAAPPTVQQMGTHVKRPRVGGTLRMCSVEMTLTPRLEDPAARNCL
jgi:hypothetical protein